MKSREIEAHTGVAMGWKPDSPVEGYEWWDTGYWFNPDGERVLRDSPDGLPHYRTDWNDTMKALQWLRCNGRRFSGLEIKSIGVEGGVIWKLLLKVVMPSPLIDKTYPVIFANDYIDPYALPTAICLATMLSGKLDIEHLIERHDSGYGLKGYSGIGVSEEKYEPHPLYAIWCAKNARKRLGNGHQKLRRFEFEQLILECGASRGQLQ